MGAKTSMLVMADGNARELLAANPALDRALTDRVVTELFPKHKLERLDDGSLTATYPPGDEVLVGCFPGLTILAAREFALDHPSRLEPRFLAHAGPRTVHLHAMHSVVDWLAFAVWRSGRLERSLSVAPDNGVIEDIGARLPFEDPFWSGARPAVDPADQEEGADPYPLPFHPLDLGEVALRVFFGFGLGVYPPDASLLDSDTVPLVRYKRKKGLFKFW